MYIIVFRALIYSDLEALYERSSRPIVGSYKAGGSNYSPPPGVPRGRAPVGIGLGLDLGPDKPVVDTVQQALASKIQGLYRAKNEQARAASK